MLCEESEGSRKLGSEARSKGEGEWETKEDLKLALGFPVSDFGPNFLKGLG